MIFLDERNLDSPMSMARSSTSTEQTVCLICPGQIYSLAAAVLGGNSRVLTYPYTGISTMNEALPSLMAFLGIFRDSEWCQSLAFLYDPFKTSDSMLPKPVPCKRFFSHYQVWLLVWDAALSPLFTTAIVCWLYFLEDVALMTLVSLIAADSSYPAN